MWSRGPNQQHGSGGGQSSPSSWDLNPVSHDILERVTRPNLLSPLKMNKPGHRIRKWLMDPDGEAVHGQSQSKDQHSLRQTRALHWRQKRYRPRYMTIESLSQRHGHLTSYFHFHDPSCSSNIPGIIAKLVGENIVIVIKQQHCQMLQWETSDGNCTTRNKWKDKNATPFLLQRYRNTHPKRATSTKFWQKSVIWSMHCMKASCFIVAIKIWVALYPFLEEWL